MFVVRGFRVLPLLAGEVVCPDVPRTDLRHGIEQTSVGV